jgi:hypothetical protein
MWAEWVSCSILHQSVTKGKQSKILHARLIGDPTIRDVTRKVTLDVDKPDRPRALGGPQAQDSVTTPRLTAKIGA